MIEEMIKVLEMKKLDLLRLEEDAQCYMEYIQSLKTPYELAVFGKDKLDKLIETQTLISSTSENIRMLEYLINKNN